jgi:hypothetical protein
VSIFPELKKEFQSGNPFSDVPMQGASMKLAFGGVITIILLLFVVSACGATTTTEDIATTAAPTLPIQTTTLNATNIPPNNNTICNTHSNKHPFTNRFPNAHDNTHANATTRKCQSGTLESPMANAKQLPSGQHCDFDGLL